MRPKYCTGAVLNTCCHQGDRAYTEGPLEVWTKPLADGSVAVGIFSRWRMPLQFTVPMDRLGFPANDTLQARDLWAHKEIPAIHGSYTVTLPPHGVVMLRVRR